MIGVGEKAFAEGNNFGRVIQALDQVYREFLPQKEWANVMFAGTHVALENVAVALGRLRNVPIYDAVPNPVADEIYELILGEEGEAIGFEPTAPEPEAG